MGERGFLHFDTGAALCISLNTVQRGQIRDALSSARRGCGVCLAKAHFPKYCFVWLGFLLFCSKNLLCLPSEVIREATREMIASPSHLSETYLLLLLQCCVKERAGFFALRTCCFYAAILSRRRLVVSI